MLPESSLNLSDSGYLVAMLRIELLRDLSISIDGQDVPSPRSLKGRLVLGFLAIKPGMHARETLASQFWADGVPEAGRASLSTELKHIRRLIGQEHLAATRDTIGLLRADDLAIDVRDFDEAIGRGEPQIAAGLWKGDFLQDVSHPWADELRHRYRLKAARAFAAAAKSLTATGQHADALELLHQARPLMTHADVLQEQLVRSLIAANNLIEARNELDDLIGAHAERGVLPPPTLVSLRKSLERGDTSKTPSPRLPAKKAANTAKRIGDLEVELPAESKTFDGLPTGFRDLDALLGGVPKSALTVIAGRPNMGASTLALTLGSTAALDLGMTCVLFCPEMTEAELSHRLIGMRARISSASIRMGRVRSLEWPRLLKATQKLSEANLLLDTTPTLSLAHMREAVEGFEREHGIPIDLVVVDDSHLLSGEASLSRDSPAAAQVLFDLRRYARDSERTIIATTKVAADCEARPDKRPTLRDLPGYSAIASRPDVVLFLYRDDYYHSDSEHINELEIIVAGNRGSDATGVATTVFIPRGPRIVNLARDVA